MLRYEKWLAVPACPQYQVSNFGRCRLGDDTDQLIEPSTPPRGYKIINCTDKTRAIHVMVLEAFVGPRPLGHWACHNDGDQSNNHVSNLRWDTPTGNFQDRDKHGKTSRGSHRWNSKLTEAHVREIKRMLRNGLKQVHIANLYNVSSTLICRINSGKLWSHVT